MFRKSMIALFAVASISMLAPDVALARGGGGGGGGHGGFGGGFGGARGFGGGVGAAGVRGGSVGSSFARSTAIGAAGVAGFQGARVATGGFNRGAWHGGFHPGFHPGFRPGFRHGRRIFVAGGFWGPGYFDDWWDYPYYGGDYYGGCFVVRERVHTRYGWRIRPVQVCG